MSSRRWLWGAAALIALGLITRAALRGEPPPPAPVPLFTLGEAARDVAGDAALVGALTAHLSGAGLLGGPEAAALSRALAAGEADPLDRLPRTDLPGLARAMDALAAARPALPPPPSAPDAGALTREVLGVPTREAPPAELSRASLGRGFLAGDRLDADKRERAADSARLADVLDRLSLNDPHAPALAVDMDGSSNVASATALVRWLMAHNHRVAVIDERFAANFGDLEKDGREVATPLWLATGWTRGDGAVIDVPAVHAQLRLEVRGRLVRADVTFFTALDARDGGLRFRADVARDQAWVGGRVAHRYEGPQALEAVRLMSALRARTEELVRAHRLPLDGYHRLGVCTLAPALVELSLTGATTLWPLTQDRALFDGQDDVDRLVRALPADGADRPDLARLLGSLPWAPASIPFPALARAIGELSAGPR